MIFSETADLVMSGDKTQTRRPLKPFDELRTTDEGISYIYNTQMRRVRFCVDKIYAVQPGRSKHGIGYICIKRIRVEKLLSISARDCAAEGIMADVNGPPHMAFILGFMATWKRLYKGTPYASEHDPDVIVLEFETITQ